MKNKAKEPALSQVNRDFVDGPLAGQTFAVPEDRVVQKVEHAEKVIFNDNGPRPVFVSFYLLRDDGKFHWHAPRDPKDLDLLNESHMVAPCDLSPSGRCQDKTWEECENGR